MPRAVHAATLDVSSLALSSTMMSCTVHSPMDSLAQPLCTVVYILCNPAPRGSPFKLSLGLHSNSQVLSIPLLFRVSCVVVCPRFALGRLRGDEDGPVYSLQRILGVGVPCIVVWQHWLMRLQDEADIHGARWSVIQMGHRFLDSLGEYACVLGSPNI